MKPGINPHPPAMDIPPEFSVERMAEVFDLMATRYGWRRVFRALKQTGERHSSKTVTAVADAALTAFHTHQPPQSTGSGK